MRGASPLVDWLERHAPALARSLGDPVTPQALADAEALLGRRLPADYVDFLRLHDGQRFVPHESGGTGTLAPIFSAFEILSLAHAAGEWRSMREWDDDDEDIETEGPVRARYAHEAWWPFTVIYGSSHHHCLDLDPAPGGKVGQVIVVSMKDLRRSVLAPSFTAFVQRLVSVLDGGGVEVGEEGIELPDEALDALS